jgi:hypothetical protein
MRGRPRTVLALAAAAALALGAASAAGAASGAGGMQQQLAHYFTITCHFSHAAPDDPIVYPGRPSRSHMHTFIGNVSTNAFSTPSTLSSKRTTCNHAGDRSAYWAPTLYAGGHPVEPSGATIYYRRLTTAPVQAFPDGLVMIAGNSHAVVPQSHEVTSWACDMLNRFVYGMRAIPMGPLAQSPAAGLPQCPASMNLDLTVNFPDCSNGKPNSPNHQSHMAYSTAGRCPASHPIPVPEISIVLRYPPVAGSDVFLASGGIYSGHADFMDGWSRGSLKSLVVDCLDSRAVCGYPSQPLSLR